MNNPYGSLAWSFFKIGLFGFGGGYAILPLIRHEMVDVHGWATLGEFSDMVAISQVTPGTIAINSATYVGLTAGGILGSTIATIMVCLAPFTLVLIASRSFTAMRDNVYVKTIVSLLRPTVIGFVLAAALSLIDRHNFVDWKSIVIFLVALVLTLKWKVHPIILIIASGVIGWFLYA